MSTATLERVERTTQRRKTFGSHSNLAHVWAQNAYSEGRSSDGRMFFHGPSVYSHGSHFEIARWTDHVFDGKRLVLVTTSTYSISTSSHTSHVHGALHGLDVIKVPVPDLTRCDDVLPLETIRERLIRDVARFSALVETDTWASDYHRPEVKRVKTLAAALVACYDMEPLPEDPAAWVKARDAELDAERKAARLSAARRDLFNITAWRAEVDGLGKPREGATGRYPAHSVRLDELLRWVRSARLAIGRNGGDVKGEDKPFVEAARAFIQHVEPLRDGWRAVELREAEAERKRGRLREMAEILTAHRTGNVTWHHKGANLESALETACAYGEADAIPELLAHVQRELLLREIRESEPLPPLVHYLSRITAEDWQAGRGTVSELPPAGPTLVRRKGNRLETSRGATVPWVAALAVYRKAVDCRLAGTSWVRNGETMPVGPYSLDRINAEGDIRVGCHSIAFDEMERLAIREVPHLVVARYPVPAVLS